MAIGFGLIIVAQRVIFMPDRSVSEGLSRLISVLGLCRFAWDLPCSGFDCAGLLQRCVLAFSGSRPDWAAAWAMIKQDRRLV